MEETWEPGPQGGERGADRVKVERGVGIEEGPAHPGKRKESLII